MRDTQNKNKNKKQVIGQKGGALAKDYLSQQGYQVFDPKTIEKAQVKLT